MSNKHEATYHGGEYTPEPIDLRVAYRLMEADLMMDPNSKPHDPELQAESDAEFDRFIAKIKAEALTDLADQMRDRFTASWIRGKARELTHGPRKITGAFAISESEADCGDNDL